MKIKFTLAAIFLLAITHLKAQELPKIKAVPEKMMMDVPVLTTDTAAALKEANTYLAKIKKVLSKDDFALYRKKEVELVPSGNPFGLLKIRQKYYKIFTNNKSE